MPNKVIPPIPHHPNWSFSCLDCDDTGFYELPQDLPEIKEAYENRTLSFHRPCGCKDNNIHPATLRLWEIL